MISNFYLSTDGISFVFLFYASMFKIHSVIQILAVFRNDGVILHLNSCSCCSKKKSKKQWETLVTW
jgi:hypothetical protein